MMKISVLGMTMVITMLASKSILKVVLDMFKEISNNENERGSIMIYYYRSLEVRTSLRHTWKSPPGLRQ